MIFGNLFPPNNGGIVLLSCILEKPSALEREPEERLVKDSPMSLPREVSRGSLIRG